LTDQAHPLGKGKTGVGRGVRLVAVDRFGEFACEYGAFDVLLLKRQKNEKGNGSL